MQNVRIWFSKTGVVKYISHLDLTRCMARALKLSGLPVWYTQGFNPRIYMTFAMPLSLGVSGLRECVDIRLTEELQELLAGETVTVMKHGKKGDKAVDIKPYFSLMEWRTEPGWLVLDVKLPCSLNGSVNPNLLLEALKTLRGLEPYGEITRKRLLTKDFSDMR